VPNELSKLQPLFVPIQKAMQKQQGQETLFRNDETTWKVFEVIEGKVGCKWYLWVTRSALKTKQSKRVSSLSNHWIGLTHFVENPLISMDNHPAEQVLRNPMAGRRSFYGSAEFAVLMMGWIKTLQIHLTSEPISSLIYRINS
jgi:hypothetical protein